MRRSPAHALCWPDFAILAASVALGAWLCYATDREYMVGQGRSPARNGETTRLPDWLKERRHDAIRVVHGGTAVLTALGLGLAVIVIRPRSGAGCPGPFSPGAIAAIVTGGLAVILTIGWAIERAAFPLYPTSSSISPTGHDLYSTWRDARGPLTWVILGAWCTLFATGRWRRPLDAADRMGRWLAAAWFILILGQAAIYVIAWS